MLLLSPTSRQPTCNKLYSCHQAMPRVCQSWRCTAAKPCRVPLPPLATEVPHHVQVLCEPSPLCKSVGALAPTTRPASDVPAAASRVPCHGVAVHTTPKAQTQKRPREESVQPCGCFSFDMSAFELSNNAPIANDDDDVAEDHAPPRPCPGAFGERAENAPQSHQLIGGSQQRYCDACKVAVSGDSNWQQHIEGEKHLRLMNHVAGFAMLRGSEQHNCKVCNVLVSGNDNWRIHIEGEKHLRKQLAAAVSAPCPSHGVILSQALNLIRQSPPGAQYVLRLMLYRDQWRSQCRAARHGRRAHAENGPTSSPLRRLQ